MQGVFCWCRLSANSPRALLDALQPFHETRGKHVLRPPTESSRQLKAELISRATLRPLLYRWESQLFCVYSGHQAAV